MQYLNNDDSENRGPDNVLERTGRLERMREHLSMSFKVLCAVCTGRRAASLFRLVMKGL